MQIETFEYSRDRGWSVEDFPALDSEQTLVVLFGDREYLDDGEAIEELVAAYPRSRVVGCSSSGEICGARVSEGTLSVAVASFEDTRLELASARLDSMEESYEAGRTLARELGGDDPRAVFVLSRGTDVNGTALVRGINEEIDEGVLVTGGLAGDADRFEKTWVVAGDELATNLVAAVGLYGDRVRISHGSKGGWDRFGPQRVVTRAEGSVLYELDDQPALDLYERYLGDQAEGLPATGLLFPLQIEPQAGKKLVRTILAVDEEERSVTYAGDIPVGASAQLMKANLHRIVDGASSAAQQSAEMVEHDGATLALAVSCVGRRLILKHRTEDELDAVLEALGDAANLVGFYSYGELSPYVEGASCELHNQTMTLTVISEA
jgi:hypothetical protein